MNDRIRDFMTEAGISVEYVINTKQIVVLEKFAELIVRECADRCGSQADQRNILRSFGLEVESNIKYTASERNGSVNSQYEREYNLPKG